MNKLKQASIMRAILLIGSFVLIFEATLIASHGRWAQATFYIALGIFVRYEVDH